MNKMIRRMLSVMPAAMFCAGALTGCGNAGTPVTAEPAAVEVYFDTEDDEYDDYEEDAEYHEQEAERKMEEELAFAKEIQTSSVPTVFPAFPEMKSFGLLSC